MFYSVPELAFSVVQQNAAVDELTRLCPDCTVRTVNIPASHIASDGPDMIVSDLQAHPETGENRISATLLDIWYGVL